MSVKLYVGNLPHAMTEAESEYPVFRGRQRGLGQDHYRPADGSAPGLRVCRDGNQGGSPEGHFHVNGRTVEGRPLTVNEARPQQRSSFGGGGGRAAAVAAAGAATAGAAVTAKGGDGWRGAVPAPH